MVLISCAVLTSCSLDVGPFGDEESDGQETDGPEGGEPVTEGPVVSLTFDDTFIDQEAAFDLLEERGMRGTFYVNSDRIGKTQALSEEQLLDWQSRGHEIAGHTIGHVDLPTLEPDEQRRAICDDRAALIEMGFTVTSFAYPFGASDASIEAIVAECGYNSARDIGGLGNPLPPPELYLIRSAPSVEPEATPDDLEGYVIEAEAAGEWVPYVFHHVCDGCSEIGVSPATLAEFLDRLEARGTPVLTVDEVVGGEMQPVVSGPPAELEE
jgi:peptidoglycan/xylan/chitin deacetylase (PgdA/CDA1 family)